MSAVLIGYSALWIYLLLFTMVGTSSHIAVPVARFSARYGIPAAAYLGFIAISAITAAAFTARQTYGWVAPRGIKAKLWVISVAVLLSVLLTIQVFL